jgi:enamine deaminase RidA (YjgF/YER057c/UK114 family)
MAESYCVHIVKSGEAKEIFITAVPALGTSIQENAEVLFANIRDTLAESNAFIFQERIFAAEAAFEVISAIRNRILSSVDDGVKPSCLVCSPGKYTDFAGIQVHAVAGVEKPRVLKTPDEQPVGRLMQVGNSAYLGLSAVTALENGAAQQQAKGMFEKANAILQDLDVSFMSVPRTWLWLGDILSWYDELNKARNSFFVENGILGKATRPPMPASTGIGLGPAGRPICAMDLTAVINPPRPIEYLQAGGKQQSAFEYGSAFSRASKAPTPGGETVFVSGTASIDAAGITTNIGQARPQIEETIVNVQAVLRDMNCGDGDVVQVMAYCKTHEVEQVFRDLQGKPDWPWVIIICDVCRHDLLFEIEATVVPQLADKGA